MKGVFADAFFYLAVLNRDDNAHARAMHWLEGGAKEVITTTAVMLEVADAMSVPTMRGACARFLDGLMNGQADTAVHPLSEDLLARGMALYRQRSDKSWSLTDCISFVVMKEEGLTRALTGDHHFEQAGFTALLK